MNKGRISVIVPVYNIKDYVEVCLQSIINQTYTNLEIILVNDGSTDGSLFVCEKYQRLDDRIIIVNQENQGLVAARKSGLKIATGEYTSFVDGDDYIEHDYYDYLIGQMSDDIDFIQRGYIREEYGITTEMPIERHKYSNPTINEKIELIDQNLLSRTDSVGWIPSIWNKLFRTELIKEGYSHVPNTQSFGEDIIATIYCVMYSKGFLCDDKVGYHYVQRKTSITNQVTDNKITEYYGLYEALLNALVELNCEKELKPGLDIYGIGLFRAHMYNVYNIHKGLGYIQYNIPNIEKLHSKRVVVYGAGTVGKSFINLLLADDNIEVVAWVDKKYKATEGNIKLSPKALAKLSFDIIFIAVKNEEQANEIQKEIVSIGIEAEKIKWDKPLEEG